MNNIIKSYKTIFLLAALIFLILILFMDNHITYKCYNLCASVSKIQNNFIQIQLTSNNVKFSNESINLILNSKYYLDTKTNEEGIFNIYAPLKLGYNELAITANSKNIKSEIYFTYLTNFINLLYILISIIILLLIKSISDNKFNSKKILIRIDNKNNKTNKTAKFIKITIKESQAIFKKIINSINKNKPDKIMAVTFDEIKNEFCKLFNIGNSYLIDDELNYLLKFLDRENILKIYSNFICTNTNITKQIASRFIYDNSLYEGSFKSNKNILKANTFILPNNLKIKNLKIIFKSGKILRFVDSNFLNPYFKFICSKNNAMFLFLELNNYIEVYKC